MHRRKLLSLIESYTGHHPEESDCTARFADFVRNQAQCFRNDNWSGHVTGSAWVVDPDGSAVLLTHHRKLGRWFQLGGHSDGDPDTQAVATREAEEEGGVAVRLLDAAIFDLDIHEIPARKADPAHFHFDVRFAFQATGREFAVSPESNQLAWVPVVELARYSTEPSMLRMQRKWLETRANESLRIVGRGLGLDGA